MLGGADPTRGGIVSQSVSGDREERIARLEQQEERLVRALELLAQRAAAQAAPAAQPGRNWDAYAALIATFIGILAVAVSGYTAHLQRQQLRAQMWPRLRLESSSVNLVFKAINQGTGPARVTAVRVMVDGKPVKTWPDVQKAAGFVDEEWLIWSTIHAAVLPADKDFTIVAPADNEQSRTRFKDLLPGHQHQHAISMTVCYCSVLDDCWVARLGETRDNGDVDAEGTCPIADGESFED
jgi:hypothetical protein